MLISTILSLWGTFIMSSSAEPYFVNHEVHMGISPPVYSAIKSDVVSAISVRLVTEHDHITYLQISPGNVKVIYIIPSEPCLRLFLLSARGEVFGSL